MIQVNKVSINEVDMELFLDKCIFALREGMTCGTDGLFISYIGEDTYVTHDPVFPECDEEEDVVQIRRRLHQYYNGCPSSYIEDRAYIEQYIRELA